MQLKCIVDIGINSRQMCARSQQSCVFADKRFKILGPIAKRSQLLFGVAGKQITSVNKIPFK